MLQSFSGGQELVGSAVVMAHRLLKSGAAELIGTGAYILITESVVDRFDVPTDGSLPLVETYEHYEPVHARVYPLRSLPSLPDPRFVPDDFEVPARLVTPDFVLEPLGPQHNERDYAAWTSSMEHILATPGLVEAGDEHPWPHPMTLGENLDDLVGHAEDFAARRGFTYTVLDSKRHGCDRLPVHLPDERRGTRRASEIVGHGCTRRARPHGVARGVGLAGRSLAVPEPTVRGPHLTPTKCHVGDPSGDPTRRREAPFSR